VWFFVVSFFTFLSAVSLGYCSLLNRRGRVGGRPGREGLEHVSNLRTVHWVNVSERSGASSPGLVDCPETGLMFLSVLVPAHLD